MDSAAVVKLIKEVCFLILDRPGTRWERLVVRKILVEVVGMDEKALSCFQESRRLGRGNIPLLEDSGR